MIGVSIRAPTDREVERICVQWLGDVLPTSRKLPQRALYSGAREGNGWERGDGFWRGADPRSLFHPRFYREAIRLLIATTAARCRFLVADLQDVPDEPVGWAAFEDRSEKLERGALHYVRVLGPARRRGIGTQLIEACGTSYPMYLTQSGIDLLDSIRSTQRPSAALPRSSDVEADGLAVVER